MQPEGEIMMACLENQKQIVLRVKHDGKCVKRRRDNASTSTSSDDVVNVLVWRKNRD